MVYDQKVERILSYLQVESVVPDPVDKFFNTKLSELTRGLVDIPPEYDVTWNELSNFDSWTDLPTWIYTVAAVFEPTGILSWPAFVEAVQDFEKEQSAWNTVFLILASLAIIPVGGKPAKLVWGFFKLLKAIALAIFKFLPGGRFAAKLLNGLTGWARKNPEAIENVTKSALPELNKISTSTGRKASETYIDFLRINKLLPEEKIKNLEKLIKQADTASEKAAKSADDAAAAKASKEITPKEKATKVAQAADDAVKSKQADKALKASKELKAAEKALKNLDDAKKLKAAKAANAAKVSKAAKAGGALGGIVGASRIANALKDPLGREIDYHKEKGEDFLNKLKQLAADSKKKPVLLRRAGFPVGKIGDIRPRGSF